MLLARKTIGSGDRALYTIDLTAWLLSIETLATVEVAVSPSTSPPLQAQASMLTESMIGVSVTGGEVDQTYSVLITYTTQSVSTQEVLRIQNDCIEVDVSLPCEL